jgi:DNA-binding transcriptional regulator YbjK
MAAATPTRATGASPTRVTGTAPSRAAAASSAAARRMAPRPRGAARREALLEAVLRIVAEVGADAVTHRRVAEEAGLPLASTTYWFNSKEHILTAALELAAERDTARLLDYAADVARRADTAEAALEAAVASIYEPLDDGAQASRGSLMATYALLLEAARRPALREIARRWTEVYLLTLGQLLELGGSRRPREDAELLLAAADGLLIEQLSTGATIDLRPRLRRLAKLLVQTP